MNVLSLNLGSSSLKYAVHQVSDGALEPVLARDIATRPERHAAKEAASRAIADVRASVDRVDAVGHRIVFGGNDDEPVRVSPELLQRLTSLQWLDPLHVPGAIAVIEQLQAELPDAVHVVCFDTAFFRNIPKTARVLPLPIIDPLLHRYGFHGLSYEYVCRNFGGRFKRRTLIAHLGNGASVAALFDGRPINSTMGFSPLGGVIMSTRPGDVDPGALLYLLEHSSLSVADLRNMLETQSGLRALSGGEADLQRLSERSDADAAFAVEMFVRSVANSIGALATELGGVDMLVFTGGIGEHNQTVRTGICNRVRFLNPRLSVLVVKTDENLMIAEHTLHIASKWKSVAS